MGRGERGYWRCCWFVGSYIFTTPSPMNDTGYRILDANKCIRYKNPTTPSTQQTPSPSLPPGPFPTSSALSRYPPPSPSPLQHPPLKSNIQISPLTLTLHYAFPAHRLPSKDPVKHIYFSAGRAQWLRTCAAISHVAASAGLREFRLILEGRWFAEDVERVPVFLEPLRNLSLSRCASRINGGVVKSKRSGR